MAQARLTAEAERIAQRNEDMKRQLRASAVHMKLLAEALEKESKEGMVEKLAGMTEELVKQDGLLSLHSQALQAVTDAYQPPSNQAESTSEHELTDWDAKVAEKMGQLEQNSQAPDPRHEWIVSFQRTVWNVHHPNEPMPGEEWEEVTMMTQALVKNDKCPITLVAVTALEDPVCSSDCRHIYSAAAIQASIKQQGRRVNPSIKCPYTGCPKTVRLNMLVCDEELQMALNEMRTRKPSGTGPSGANPEEVEDI